MSTVKDMISFDIMRPEIIEVIEHDQEDIKEQHFNTASQAQPFFIPQPSATVVTNNIRSFSIPPRGSAEGLREIAGRWFRYSPVTVTGVWLRQGESVQVFVHGTQQLSALIGTPGMQESWFRRFTLNPGANTVTRQDNNNQPTSGMLYFENEATGTPPIVVDVTGGRQYPVFRLGIDTDSSWQSQLNQFSDALYVELVGERSLLTVKRTSAIANLRPDVARIIRDHDDVVRTQDEVSGIAPFLPAPHHPDPNTVAHTELLNRTTWSMSATHFSSGYSGTALGSLLNADNFRSSAWGPWHEAGHQRQMLAWLWNSNLLQEVTVNIYSLYTEREFGNISRLERDNHYNAALNFVNRPHPKNFDSSDSGLSEFRRLVMFWQLDLAFGKEFYPRLHQAYRELPASEQMFRNGGELARQMFIYMSSRIANRNLEPFFDAWGMHMTPFTRNRLSQFPPLERTIWFTRDSNLIREYEILTIDAPVVNGTNVTQNQVTLNWNRPLSTWGHGQYDILRNGVRIAQVDGNTFTDTHHQPSSTFDYTVVATNLKGDRSGASNGVRVANGQRLTPPAIPPRPLPAPTLPVPQQADLDGVRVRIFSAVNGSSGLEASGEQVIIAPRRDNNRQIWEFADAGNGGYIVKNVGSGTYLSESGTTLLLTTNPQTATRWRLVGRNPRIIHEIRSVSSGRAIDLPHSSTTEGNRVATFNPHGNANQRWLFEDVDPVMENVAPPSEDISHDIIPFGLTLSNITQSSIKLTWLAPINQAHTTGYTILRNNEIVATVPLGVTEYNDTGLLPNTTYTYAVQSGNISGLSQAVTVGV